MSKCSLSLRMGLTLGLTLTALNLVAQPEKPYVSKAWVADQGDGTYKNPIIYADYSDPDVCRVGEDYYMVSSSFNCAPALPVLHSKDLVNWQLIGHVSDQVPPFDNFKVPQHGNGVWAPSLRYHNGEFYVYYGDPDHGIFMSKTKNPAGPWEPIILVQEGKGLIDPSPLWDDDGNAYLVHAFAGSRAGIKSLLVVNKMSPDGKKLLDDGVVVFDGHDNHPTVEGPKFYKRNGYYYIFAPAGGVSTGWQLILRSKNIYGPYEEKVVLEQGSTEINGPHQGGWIDTPDGKEHWFIHFQDQEAYGRVVHMQPVNWVNDWPMMGEDKDGNGIGEPVLTYHKPKVGKTYPVATPVDSDEFSGNELGVQWQWHANPHPTWFFPSPAKGEGRLFAVTLPEDYQNLWQVPNLLLQKFPANEFTATSKMKFSPRDVGEKTGLLIMGMDYSYLGLEKREDGIYLIQAICEQTEKGNPEQVRDLTKVDAEDIWLQVQVKPGEKYQFAWSSNGKKFKTVGPELTAKPGKWIGAKVGLFCTREKRTNDSGWVDVDWFRIN